MPAVGREQLYPFLQVTSFAHTEPVGPCGLDLLPPEHVQSVVNTTAVLSPYRMQAGAMPTLAHRAVSARGRN